VWGIIKEDLDLAGQTLTRDFLQHMGAVAIVAVNEKDEVLTVTQYRHAIAMDLVEIPAGLLDEMDESPLEAAQRELLEETGYTAAHWQALVDVCTTPGSSSETIRIFLATELAEHAWEAENLSAEEKEISRHWVPVASAVEHILAGDWTSPTAVSGILAYVASRQSSLRGPNAAWPVRDHVLKTNRVFRKQQ
jgi:ADP-ribose pyrophosphatase